MFQSSKNKKNLNLQQVTNVVHKQTEILEKIFELFGIIVKKGLLTEKQIAMIQERLDEDRPSQMNKMLKIMGYEDNPDAKDPDNFDEQIKNELYDMQAMDLICGQWTPWLKKQLPDVFISKISQGRYLLEMIDTEKGIKHCSIEIEYDGHKAISFILHGENVTLEYCEPECDHIDGIQIKSTLFLRKSLLEKENIQSV